MTPKRQLYLMTNMMNGHALTSEEALEVWREVSRLRAELDRLRTSEYKAVAELFAIIQSCHLDCNPTATEICGEIDALCAHSDQRVNEAVAGARLAIVNRCRENAANAETKSKGGPKDIPAPETVEALIGCAQTWETMAQMLEEMTLTPADAQAALTESRQEAWDTGYWNAVARVVDYLTTGEPPIISHTGKWDRLKAALAAHRAGQDAPPPSPQNPYLCAVCGWLLAESVDKGCVRGNCSMRPRPQNLYDKERAYRERAEAVQGQDAQKGESK